MKGRESVARRVSLGLAPWIAAIALWYGVRLSGYVNVSLIPAPHQVAAKFVELLLHEGLLYDVFASTRRVFLGVALGIVAAVPVGFLLGWYRPARTLADSELEIFRKVIIPLTVPHILTALRVSLGVAWATLVASELIAAQRGLGAMIQNAATYFLLDIIYVGIICIGCVALLMDTILRRISARLLVWQERAVA